MAPLQDQLLRQRFMAAFREAASGVGGYVEWLLRPQQWMKRHLDGESQRSVAVTIASYLEAGGEIDQVRERRSEYANHRDYHYDVRCTISGQYVYVEAIVDEHHGELVVTIVSMHDVERGVRE